MWRPSPGLPLPYVLNLIFSLLCIFIFDKQTLNAFSVSIFLLLVLSYFSLQGSSPGYVSATTSSRPAYSTDLNRPADLVLHEYGVDDGVSEGDLPLGEKKKKKRKGSYCEVCSQSIPLRAYHCRDCGRCVHLLDHHCHFINTCIGEKNHFRFILFLAINMIAIVVFLINIKKSIATTTIISTRSLRIFRLIAEVYFVLLSIFTGLLLAFHLFLMLTSSRTFELMAHRGQREEVDPCDCPYSIGPIHNIIQLVRSDAIFSSSSSVGWKPVEWIAPATFTRDDVTICENPLNNKYYSCC